METVAAVTRHPYRSKPLARTAVVNGRARRLAAHGAAIVLVCLVCRWFALVFSPTLVVAAELFLVVGAWLFTLRVATDNGHTRGLGWVLRSLAIADSAIVIANSSSGAPWNEIHKCLTLLILPVVGMLYLAARFHSFGLPQLTRKVVTGMAVCVGCMLCCVAGGMVSVYVTLLFTVISFLVYLALWVWGFALMVRMRRILWVEVHEWWLDVGALPCVEWTSYAHLRDGRVELVGTGGETCWFENCADAIFWLTKSGFCPQDQALARRLADRAPAGAAHS